MKGPLQLCKERDATPRWKRAEKQLNGMITQTLERRPRNSGEKMSGVGKDERPEIPRSSRWPAGPAGKEEGRAEGVSVASPFRRNPDPGACFSGFACLLTCFRDLSRPCCLIHLPGNRCVSGGRRCRREHWPCRLLAGRRFPRHCLSLHYSGKGIPLRVRTAECGRAPVCLGRQGEDIVTLVHFCASSATLSSCLELSLGIPCLSYHMGGRCRSQVLFQVTGVSGRIRQVGSGERVPRVYRAQGISNYASRILPQGPTRWRPSPALPLSLTYAENSQRWWWLFLNTFFLLIP